MLVITFNMNKSFEEQIVDACNNKQHVFIFISKDDEVDTKPVIQQLLTTGKRVIVPICDVSENKILLSEIKNLHDLFPASYGILEPKKIIPFLKKNIDLFFVPGTRFDKEGNRKGRGKGYFDRFLEDIKGKKPIIGICFEDQVINKLETKPWDIPVDKLIVKQR